MAVQQNSRNSSQAGGSKAPSETGHQANNPQQPGTQPAPKEGDIRKVQWNPSGDVDGTERSEDEIMEEEAQREKENLMNGKEDEY